MNETYTVKGSCNNCGYTTYKQKPKGDPIGMIKYYCPNCGCLELIECKNIKPSTYNPKAHQEDNGQYL